MHPRVGKYQQVLRKRTVLLNTEQWDTGTVECLQISTQLAIRRRGRGTSAGVDAYAYALHLGLPIAIRLPLPIGESPLLRQASYFKAPLYLKVPQHLPQDWQPRKRSAISSTISGHYACMSTGAAGAVRAYLRRLLWSPSYTIAKLAELSFSGHLASLRTPHNVGCRSSLRPENTSNGIRSERPGANQIGFKLKQESR